jgi:hypothetical protein
VFHVKRFGTIDGRKGKARGPVLMGHVKVQA